GINGQIAFTQGVLDFNGGAPASVFTANPDGSNSTQAPLPEGTRVEIFSVPVWSPDGTELLISHTLRLDNTGQCCFFQPATVNLAHVSRRAFSKRRRDSSFFLPYNIR